MSERFDLVIVGAGIQGAGVAQAAAVAGLRVLMLEKKAIAAGTSSQSSKLIHGGLRYLESGQFRFVRQALAERRQLLELAPKLVKLVPFYLPIYRHSRRRSWQIRVGLHLYRALGGFVEETFFSKLTRSEWQNLDGLDTDDLIAVYRYYDAQTDDALLTQAVVQSAQKHGAELRLPAELISANLHDEHVEIVYADPQTNAQHTCTAGVLVNCAGPWAGEVLRRVEPALPTLEIELVQGSHLWLQRPAPSGCFYLEAPDDRRGVFVMPWKGEILLGTTETVHHGPPDTAACLPQEVDYLLRTLAHYFPQHAGLTEEAIRHRYCGLRVLPRVTGSPFGRSREVMIEIDRRERPRVVSVVGGKLTTYRLTAQQVMAKLNGSLPPCGSYDTSAIPLSLD